MLLSCGDDPGDEPPPADEVTWHGDIAPIFAEHCEVCHHDGGVGGFSLDNYDDAKVLATWVSNTVRTGKMPPWSITESEDCTPVGPYRNALGLSSTEIDLIEEWAETRTAEGDPETATPLPEPVDRSLVDPTQTIERGEGWQASNTQDAEEFRCFLLDPELDSTRWLTGLQVAPDALEVLHHVFAYAVPPDRVTELEEQVGDDGSFECFSTMGFGGLDPLIMWLPDSLPLDFPEDSGVRMDVGSRILLQAHYHTWAVGAADATTLDLRWQDEEPVRSASLQVFGNEDSPPALQPGPEDPPSGPAFLIPRFAYDHTESLRLQVEEGAAPRRIWGFGPRMNYVGKAIRLTLEKASGETRCLGDVGRWSIDMMRFYQYDVALDELPLLEAGDALTIECTYDNTTGNEELRDVLASYGVKSPQDTPLGAEPLDEQCMVVLGLVDP